MIPRLLLIFSQWDYLIQVVNKKSHTQWQTVQIQISWLLKKPTDLDLHCLQRQSISGFSRTRVNFSTTFISLQKPKEDVADRLCCIFTKISRLRFLYIKTRCTTTVKPLSFVCHGALGRKWLPSVTISCLDDIFGGILAASLKGTPYVG